MQGSAPAVDLERRSSAAARARRAVPATERSRAFRWLVRAGFLARAITYAVIGGLALAMALGAGSDSADANQQGALTLIASAPLGRVAIVVLAAGLLAYAIWKVTQGLRGQGPEGGGRRRLFDRVANLGGGVVYLGFFAAAVRVLVGSGGSGSSQPRQAASGALGLPGGDVLVGVVGGGLVLVSGYQIYDAVRGAFAREMKLARMTAAQRRLFMWSGRVGLVFRALVFMLVGYFLLRTAVESDPRMAVGVDGALAQVHREPLGPWLLAFVALGLLLFAAYSLLEGRYRRL